MFPESALGQELLPLFFVETLTETFWRRQPRGPSD
jgi:hypothetical protein